MVIKSFKLVYFIGFIIMASHFSCEKSGKRQEKEQKTGLISKNEKCEDLNYIENNTVRLFKNDSLILSEYNRSYSYKHIYKFINEKDKTNHKIKIIKLDSISTPFLFKNLKKILNKDSIQLYVSHYYKNGKYDLIITFLYKTSFPKLITKVYLITVDNSNCSIRDVMLVYKDINEGIINPGEIKSFITKNNIYVFQLEDTLNYSFPLRKRNKGFVELKKKTYKIKQGKFILLNIEKNILLFEPQTLEIIDTLP